jgi:hypothetical protein
MKKPAPGRGGLEGVRNDNTLTDRLLLPPSPFRKLTGPSWIVVGRRRRRRIAVWRVHTAPCGPGDAPWDK